VAPHAATFVRTGMWGLVPTLLWATFRQGLQALRKPSAVVVSIVGGNLVNLLGNWIFTLGHLGSRALGSEGAARSLVLGAWSMLALILWSARGELLPRLRPWHPGSVARRPLLRTLRVGLPIGIQTSIEYTTFAFIAVIAGWFGADAIGGHQVAINLASITFMVPMGFGAAAAVLVGHAIGEGDVAHARRVAGGALACGAGFMAICGAFMILSPAPFARFYTSVPSVFAVAVALIPIAGVFQIFDGLQVVSAGILRGAGDTRTPMLVNLLGFWLVGLPVSLVLGFRMKLGVVGLWWGFVAGLAVIATLLVTLVRLRLSGAIARVRVEEGAAAPTA
jgi:MATE family multidrug resistance protein